MANVISLLRAVGPGITILVLALAPATALATDAHVPAAAAAGGPQTWYTVEPDPRLCPSPLCGGVWVTRVNKSFTVCADGNPAPRCYAAGMDFAGAGLTPEQEWTARGATGHLLVRASLEPAAMPPFGTLGVLRVQEAWLGHAKVKPSGTFYRARNSGIVCIAYPCPSVRIARLDRPRPMGPIAGVDLAAVTSDPADAYAQLDRPEGLIAAGVLVPVTGPAGASRVLQGSEYYVPVRPAS